MATPPTVLFVAPFGLRQKGTVRARTLPLARELARRGHSVTVLIPPWDSPQDAGRRWDDQGVHVVHVPLAGGPPLVLARLLQEIGRSRPDIVHVVKPRAYAGLVQWWLWQRRGAAHLRLLLDVDDWEQAWAPINGYPWPLARFLAWQEEWGIRHAHGITAASRWLVERISQVAPHLPVCYLPNGVNPPEESAEPVAAGRDVLFFTRFVEVEPAWLAQFWQALRPQAPGTQLLVAGQAVNPAVARRFRERLPLPHDEQEGIQWLGYVDPSTLDRLYRRAGCAIFPAMETPLHQAKCSVRLATTLLQGIPVVASAVGEQAAYGAEGAAWLLPADATPAQFAAAVAQVLQTPERGRILAQRARERLLTRYAWAHLGRRLEEFYGTIQG